MKLGEKIYKCRKDAKMSQEELASLLGVSRQAVSKWELNESMPDTDNVICLSRIFEVSLDYLLKEETDIPEKVQFHSETEITEKKKWYIIPGILLVAAALCLIYCYQNNMIGLGLVWVVNVLVLACIGYIAFLIVKALKRYTQK